jgi:transposase-like protein
MSELKIDLSELEMEAKRIRGDAESCHWPESFKDLVRGYVSRGATVKAISDATGISTFSIYGWKGAGERFKRIRVREKAKTGLETGLSIRAPNGSSILGLSFQDMKELLREGLL